jgi:hypothetical protein
MVYWLKQATVVSLILLSVYTVRPARMRSSVPLLEPGPPRFFGGMENNE